MLKEFIEHIQRTTQPVVKEIEGRNFVLHGDGGAEELRPTPDRIEPITLNSLDALEKMVKTEAMKLDNPLYLTVPTPTKVECFAQPREEDRWFRQGYYLAKATDVPGWDSKVTMGFDEMQIALRTRFQETTDSLYAQRLLSDITTGGKITYNDNGVATSIVTRKGIDLQANETIRPIIKLKPYRTFQELEQPESEFLIRVNERGITFVEADGGMWRLRARQIAKAWLEERFASEIDAGTVVVML